MQFYVAYKHSLTYKLLPYQPNFYPLHNFQLMDFKQIMSQAPIRIRKFNI